MSYTYKQIKEMNVGELFYEYDYTTVLYRLITAPVEKYCESLGKNQLSWVGEAVSTNEIVDFLTTEGLSHYGPNIYGVDVPLDETYKEFIDKNIV